jgi:hypothetical protein
MKEKIFITKSAISGKRDRITVVKKMFHIKRYKHTAQKKKKEEQTYLPVKDTSILISPLAGHQCSQTWEVRLCSPIALFFSRSLFVSLVFR